MDHGVNSFRDGESATFGKERAGEIHYGKITIGFPTPKELKEAQKARAKIVYQSGIKESQPHTGGT